MVGRYRINKGMGMGRIVFLSIDYNFFSWRYSLSIMSMDRRGLRWSFRRQH